jgi:hypothetical protein
MSSTLFTQYKTKEVQITMDRVLDGHHSWFEQGGQKNAAPAGK